MRRYAKPVAAAVAMVLAGASGAALADAPKLSDVLTASGITMTGYVAASYFYSTTANGDNGTVSWHQFDVGHDTFQLDQAGLTVAYQPTEGFGALVNVIAGHDATIVNVAEGSSASDFNVTQAFVQYATGGLTVMGGKFVTLAGAEVIAPSGNTNFSRSLLFFTEPLTHTGLRASYKFSDAFSLTAGVNNGWNTTHSNHDATGGKTAEVGISFTPIPLISIGLNGYFGDLPQADLTTGQHELVDLVVTIKPTDALNFVINYDYHKQKDTSIGDVGYQGIAGYVNYQFTDQFRVSLRGEVLDDKDGYLDYLASGGVVTKQKIKEATLTFGYMPTTNFELRLEGRYDKSGSGTNEKLFEKTDGTFDDTSTEVAVQGLFKF